MMLYDGSAQDKAGESKWNVVIGAECASQEPAIWVSGRLIGRRVEICRDKKCATHGKDAPTQGRASGSKGGTTPKLSAADKARAEAQKAERQKLLKKVETERAYRERLWQAIAAADVNDKAEQHIVRQACTTVVMQGGAFVARALGMPDNAFDYGARDGAIGRVAALPYKNVLRAAALALVVAEVGVSEYSVCQGEKPKRMEETAALLGLDVATIRTGKPAKPKVDPKKAAKKKTPKQVLRDVVDAAASGRLKKIKADLEKPAKSAAKKGAGKGAKR